MAVPSCLPAEGVAVFLPNYPSQVEHLPAAARYGWPKPTYSKLGIWSRQKEDAIVIPVPLPAEVGARNGKPNLPRSGGVNCVASYCPGLYTHARVLRYALASKGKKLEGKRGGHRKDRKHGTVRRPPPKAYNPASERPAIIHPAAGKTKQPKKFHRPDLTPASKIKCGQCGVQCKTRLHMRRHALRHADVAQHPTPQVGRNCIRERQRPSLAAFVKNCRHGPGKPAFGCHLNSQPHVTDQLRQGDLSGNHRETHLAVSPIEQISVELVKQTPAPAQLHHARGKLPYAQPFERPRQTLTLSNNDVPTIQRGL